jgi:hypothetical protein
LTELLDRVGIADAGHNIFALGIEQVLAHHLLIAGGRVAGEGHACAGVFAHVAEDHRHDVDGRAQVIGDGCGLAVIHSLLAHPGFEHSLGGQFHLLVNILGKSDLMCFL